MDNQKRLILAIALSFGLTLLWSKFFQEPQAEAQRLADEKAKLEAAQADAGTLAQAVLEDGGVAAQPEAPVAADPGTLAQAEPAPEAKELTLERATTKYVFHTKGAGLAHAVLHGKKEHEQNEVSLAQGWKQLFGAERAPFVAMDLAVPVPGRALPLSIAVLGDSPVPADLVWKVEDEAQGRVKFTANHGPWKLAKTFEWPNEGYQGRIRFDATLTKGHAKGELLVNTVRAIDPKFEEAPSMFGGVGNEAVSLCHVGDDLERVRPNTDPPVEKKGVIGMFGIDQQYFTSALYPLGAPKEGRCTLTSTKTARSVDAAFPFDVNEGQTTSLELGFFLGPKDLELLAQAQAGGPTIGAEGGTPAGTPPGTPSSGGNYPKLTQAVDFGIWAAICQVMLPVMRFFHGLTGNWGVAIILLTVLVKVLLLPLTHKAMVSAEAMKKLAPKMEEIKKKYPDDRERQNLETMKLYQEAKVNPLGGCLPLLLQIPVWGALFTTLRNSYELYGEPFVGPVWVDLTYKDPTYLLPLALGVTMIITQRMQPQMMDATQAKIMTWFMPIFFTAIMMNYPAGLALYIFTNNLLSIVQQQVLKRILANKESGNGTGPVARERETAR